MLLGEVIVDILAQLPPEDISTILLLLAWVWSLYNPADPIMGKLSIIT